MAELRYVGVRSSLSDEALTRKWDSLTDDREGVEEELFSLNQEIFGIEDELKRRGVDFG